MKLLFKQRFFSWFDSYDIFDEAGNTVYIAKGQLSWGHRLKVFDAYGNELGVLRERVFSFLPKFEIYQNDQCVGCISKEFTFFRPRYNIDYKGWKVRGDFFEWDYQIMDQMGDCVATISKELLQWTDTYVIDVPRPEDAFSVLMLVLAIDAEKCTRNSGEH